MSRWVWGGLDIPVNAGGRKLVLLADRPGEITSADIAAIESWCAYYRSTFLVGAPDVAASVEASSKPKGADLPASATQKAEADSEITKGGAQPASNRPSTDGESDGT